jgi:hypothetical protein
MTNLLEQAINCDDGDRAASVIKDALGIESDDVGELLLSKGLAVGSRGQRPHHRRLAARRSAPSGLSAAVSAEKVIVLGYSLCGGKHYEATVVYDAYRRSRSRMAACGTCATILKQDSGCWGALACR